MSDDARFFANPKYMSNVILENEYAAVHSEAFDELLANDKVSPMVKQWFHKHAQDVEREYTRRRNEHSQPSWKPFHFQKNTRSKAY